MADLNVMLLEHARTGLQTQLDTAVTNGDTEAARKAADELGKLNSAVAPKAPPYGDAEIKAALEAKADWFGIDPRKSGAAMRLGKDMNPKKFGSADAFADALIKAVDEEFKPASGKAPAAGEEDADDDADGKEDTDGEDADEETPAKPVPHRRTDGPGEGDAGGGRSARRAAGPWAKMSDAPADVQKEIRRTADKFGGQTKESRDKFIAKALEAQYNQAQRNKKAK